MANEKSRVLVLGGTGYLGKRLAKASLREGHPTYVLQRPENCMDINKIQLLLRLKKHGAKFIEGSLSDHESLVRAVKQVDVVISALSSSDISTTATQLQLKIVAAIKDAGNVKVQCFLRRIKSAYLEMAMPKNELVEMWEKISGTKLERSTMSAEDYLAVMNGAHPLIQFGISHNYPIFYEGYLRHFDLKEGDEEATVLYLDVEYTTVEEYLKRYV